MTDHVDVTFYAQVEPEWSPYASRNGEPHLRGARVARLNQRKPDPPLGGAVTVKLTLRLPVSAFRPLQPEAVVVVPESLTQASPVEVTVEDPGRAS